MKTNEEIIREAEKNASSRYPFDRFWFEQGLVKGRKVEQKKFDESIQKLKEEIIKYFDSNNDFWGKEDYLKLVDKLTGFEEKEQEK